MMINFIKKNYGIFLSFFLLLFFVLYIVIDSHKMRLYPKTLSFENLYINIQLYEKSPSKVKKILHNLEKIYQKYEKQNEELLSLQKTKQKKIKIDNPLYEILKYAKDFSLKTKKYSILNDEIEYFEKNASKELPSFHSMEDLILSSNQIENKNLSLDIRFLSLAFANQEVKDYLMKENVSSYLINASGRILVGKSYQKEKYKIGLEDSNHTYYKTLELENTSLATTGESIEKFTYQGKNYAKVIDPETHKPADIYKNVTVIGKDPILNEVLSKVLFLLPAEEGKNFLKDFESVEVIMETKEGETLSYTSKSLLSK